MALASTRNSLRPHGVGIVPTPDDRYRLFPLDHRSKGERICACPEMAYIVGLRFAAELRLA
jgi:hypothetical protein